MRRAIVAAVALVIAIPVYAGVMDSCAALFSTKNNKPLPAGKSGSNYVTGADLNAVQTAVLDLCRALKAVQGSLAATGGGTKPPDAVVAEPAITSCSPLTGRVGTEVTCQGSGLSTTVQVKVGTVVQGFTKDSDAQIRFSVAAGTATGSITVTTASPTPAAGGTFTVSTGVPAAPTSFASGTATSSTVPLSWLPVSGATGYVLERASDENGVPGNYAALATLEAVTTYTASGLAPSTKYWFRVYATNENGAGPAASLAATTATPASIVLNATPAQIDLPTDLPNPLRGQYVWEDADPVPGSRIAPDYYKRWNWSQFEPTKDSFNWSLIDEYLAFAAARGGRFGFRLMPLSAGPSTSQNTTCSGAASAIPAYLCALMTGQVMGDGDGHDWFIPDWNDADYLAAVDRVNAAIATHYANDPRLAYVDIGSYGTWGEWHLSPFDGVGTPTPITATNAQAIIDSYHSRFGAKGKFVLMLTADETALAYALGKTDPYIGLRIDSLGNLNGGGMSWAGSHLLSFYGDDATWQATGQWRRAPVMTEWAITPIGASFTFAGAEEQVRTWHMSTLSSGNWDGRYPETNGEPSIPAGADLASFNTANAEAGYRLRITSATVTIAGKDVSTSISFVNDGVAPTYLNWNETLRIAGPVTVDVPIYWDLRTVLDSTPVVFTFTAVNAISSLPAGTYTVSLRVDDAQGLSAPMYLAQTGRDGNGFYVLGTVTVL